MLATVSGAVRAPRGLRAAVGTPIAALLAWSRAAPDAAAVLIGGYFGTWHEAQSVAGVPMSPQWLRQAGAAPGAGVLIVLPAAACGLSETARVLGYLADQSADQCGPCAFGLPAIAADFADLASGRADGAVLERLERRFGVLTGRGACRHPDGAVRLAASALTVFAADARAHAGHLPCAAARRGAAGGGAHACAPALGGGRVGMSRRLHLDPIACAGHGLCADLLPEAVDLDEWGYPILRTDTIGPGLLRYARRAVNACPTLALRLVRPRTSRGSGDQDGGSPLRREDGRG